MQTYDAAVLIGRFQPYHKGHAALLEQALALAPRVVVVLGSAMHAASAKNPFLSEERAAMIRSTLSETDAERVSFIAVRNYYDDVRWAAAVSAAVKAQIGPSTHVALIGHLKDASSYYLNLFPDWAFVEAPSRDEIDATAIRQIYFEGEDEAAVFALLEGLVPKQINHYLRGWRRLPQFAAAQEEHLALREYKKTWGSGPFVTLDAVVRANDHILLIRRGDFPGKGLWALPGGFLEPRERLLQGAIRELKEETGLGTLDTLLIGALKATAVFDHPDRSQRGRTITHAHYFDLGGAKLPEVVGTDDAAEAHWISIAELPAMEAQFFEDHFNILDHFLNLTT